MNDDERPKKYLDPLLFPPAQGDMLQHYREDQFWRGESKQELVGLEDSDRFGCLKEFLGGMVLLFLIFLLIQGLIIFSSWARVSAGCDGYQNVPSGEIPGRCLPYYRW